MDLRKINMTSRRTFQRLLTDERHRVIYCSIPKAACTTFKTLMAKSLGWTRDSDGMAQKKYTSKINAVLHRLGVHYLSRYTPEERFRRLSDYRKFIVVRHPFTRLYSAYNDKIAHRRLVHPNYYRDVVREYFAEGVDKNGKLNLTLEQFLTLIAREYRSGRFVNRHWISYNEACHPCHVTYNYVIKLEDLRDYAPDITNLLGVTSKEIEQRNSYQLRNGTSATSRKGNGYLYEEHFNTLPKKLINGLLRVYESDFKLFGYNVS